jgi:hypothetical protein
MEAALAAGLLREEARVGGVLYWLGLCQVLMANLVEERPDAQVAGAALHAMLVLGLTGLGADPAYALVCAVLACDKLRS